MVDRTPTTRPCFYQKASDRRWLPGIFHAWSIDFETDLHVQFPVAIIEDDETGMCQSIYVERVCFSEVAPS